MSPTVVAAIIAASVSFLTLIGTLAVQWFSRRATSNQLDKTLAEQHDRTLNERFSTAADKLGNDKPPAVRVAGVLAMAGLADDWTKNRQTCISVLCAYLRMPFATAGATPKELLEAPAEREVRHTVIRVIAAHLAPDAMPSWRGLDLDFTGVDFDGGDFRGAEFSGGTVSFSNAWFSSGPPQPSGGQTVYSGEVSFAGAKFSGATVSFTDANFVGGKVRFDDAEFSGSKVSFDRAAFSLSPVSFDGAKFSGGEVSFIDAKFSGGEVDFSNVVNWSHPPVFGWSGAPPMSVLLPKEAGPLVSDAADRRAGG